MILVVFDVHLGRAVANVLPGRRAGLAPTSDALEEWHRYSLPSFTEGMKMRRATTARKIISRGPPKAVAPAIPLKLLAKGG